MALDFVKFQKGTQADYNLLKQRGRVEENTLYFLYAEGDDTGVLYCGSVLIGSVGSGASISSISELNDVLIENAGATDILVYSSDGKWKNTPISELADLIAAQSGLGFSVNESIFTLTPVDSVPVLDLKGFAEADTGSMPFKAVDGSIGWSTYNVDNLAGDIADLSTALNQLEANIDAKIAAANHLKYAVVADLSEAIQDNTIYLIPNGESTGSNKYNEFMIVDGALEDLGSFGVDLDGYVTTDQLTAQLEAVVGDMSTLSGYDPATPTTLVAEINKINATLDAGINFADSRVGDLTQLLTYNADTPTTIVEEINNIYQHLTWGRIINE